MQSPTEWNRFDICEAWYLFASEWHEGQGSDTLRHLRAVGPHALPAVPDPLHAQPEPEWPSDSGHPDSGRESVTEGEGVMTAPSAKTFADLLQTAVTEPGTISRAYQQFHSYSLGNQLLAMSQCAEREIRPGPINTFPGWKALGRHVRKGERAITLCMPITVKRKGGELATDEPDEVVTRFIYKPRWFVLSQTEGQEVPEPEIPAWDKADALDALNIREIPFDSPRRQLPGLCAGPLDRHQPAEPAAAQDEISRARPRPAGPHRRGRTGGFRDHAQESARM